MKISREVKTALLAIGAIILFIYGYTFLKGQNIFSSSRTFYAVYEEVGGLTPSAPVTINGLKVGSVSNISFMNSRGDLLVTLTVANDFPFSENSIAKIVSSSLLGGKAMAIEISKEGAPAVSGDTLTSKIEKGLIATVGKKLNPLKEKVESAITSTDSLVSSFNKIFNKESREDLKSTFNDLSATMASLKKASTALANVLSENKENLNSTLVNFSEASANIKQFSDSLTQMNINELTTSIESVVSNLESVTTGLKKGEGTLGKLLQDEGVYNNLESATQQLKELLRDMKLNPDRYVHFSIFGGKADDYEPPKDSSK